MSDDADERPRARPVARRPRDDHEDDRPRKRRRDSREGVCPKCGSDNLSSGPWPWYLGTVGAMVCKAMVCDDCNHEFDLNKPHADLATRKRNLAIIINGVGFLGILAVCGGLFLWLRMFMNN